MPSQQQLRWSELRVGITVIIAAVTLAVLIFLMSGTTGFFSSKVRLVTYFDNAEQIRVGSPVDLQGVQIGNVKAVRVVRDRQFAPVQVVMQVNTKYQFLLRKDTTATVVTAGVLGEAFIDLNSKGAKDRQVQDGDEIPSSNVPGFEDVVRSSQSTLQNLDILVKRLDRLVVQVESGKGSLGQVINDPTLMNKANAILNQIQGLLDGVNKGKGTIGQLFSDEKLANKFVDAVDKLNRIIDETETGKNNVGKLLKDESLYNNLHQTVTKANKFMDDLNSSKGTVGKLVKDEEMGKKLENTINRLSALADKLDTGEGSAALFLRNPSFYNNSDQLLVETRGLIKAVRENPKKYLTINLKIF